MQKKFCREYCHSKNITYFKEYEDIGFRGNVINRPALKELLRDVEEGVVNRIVVYKVDRLGRDFNYLNSLNESFSKSGVNLVSATQNFNFGTREGKFILRILMVLAEFESELTSSRIVDGLRARKG